MARPSHVRDSVRELIEGEDRHDWSIEDLHAGILASGLTADYSSVFRAVNVNLDLTLSCTPLVTG